MEGGQILCGALESPSEAQANFSIQLVMVILTFLMASTKFFGLQVKGQTTSICASVSVSDLTGYV